MLAHLYFDGSCYLEEGVKKARGGWLAFVFSSPFVTATGTTPPVTKGASSCLAEWKGLEAGLKWVKHLGKLSRLVVMGDFEGAVKVINDEKKVRESTPWSGAAAECRRLLKELNVPFTARKVSRPENYLADRLSKNVPTGLLTASDLIPNSPARDEAVRAMAEYRWRMNGCPGGQDERFWYEAEEMLTRAFV
jgi:ribonuclease HI